MACRVLTEARSTTTGIDGTVYILEADDGRVRAEVWPAFGFNAYAWHVRTPAGPLSLLYADPQLFHGSSPTRSGIPVLFPFPNRIRDGRFRWQGKEYQLPPNDPAKKNAIHGFACRHPWRVVARAADDEAASVTGEFRPSVDAPDALPLWPADYRLRLTCRLARRSFWITAEVENPDRVPLPFGLGYHPYLRLPLTATGVCEDCRVRVTAAAYWELDDSLPTGARRPVDGPRDLNTPRPCADLVLDDVLTDLTGEVEAGPGGLRVRGVLEEPSRGVSLRLLTDAGFRELVVFTPPHRKAIALEPYTCPTDAVHLQERGLDVGWRVLAPGERWSGVVELRLEEG